jgi:hypothetical protein
MYNFTGGKTDEINAKNLGRRSVRSDDIFSDCYDAYG